jgi:hypothetical protein
MDSRKEDILEILEGRSKAKNSYERDMADRALSRIRSESKEVESIRKKLIMAIRNRDNRAMQRFQYELMIYQANQTGGRQF